MDKQNFILTASVMFIRSQDVKNYWEEKGHILENIFNYSESLENLASLCWDCVRGGNDV